MASPSRLACQIADTSSVAGTVSATPTPGTYLLQDSGGNWANQPTPSISLAATAGSLWSIALPTHEDCLPTAVIWLLTLPDGMRYSGTVTRAMVQASQGSPLTIYALQSVYGWARTVGSNSAIPTSAAVALFMVGPGPWDGVSAGHFAGNVNGTALGISAPSGYTGNLADFQVGGVGQFSVNNQGILNLATTSGDATIQANGTAWFRTIAGNASGIYFPAATQTMSAGATLQILAQAAGSVPFVVKGKVSQTSDLQTWIDSSSNVQLGVMNKGTGASPVWALRVRATANAESMAQAHVIGAATGKAIQVFDDAGVSLGWIALYA